MLKISNIRKRIFKEDCSFTKERAIKYINDYLKKNYVVKDLNNINLFKLSIDSRHETLYYVISATFECSNEEYLLMNHNDFTLYQEDEVIIPTVKNKEKVLVVGMGPSGLFLAKVLVEAGLLVTLIDRGECVEERVKTVEGFFNGEKLNPESNIQYGEGGAGTFSDGKLTTGTNSIYNKYVMKTFVSFGASDDILYSNFPHIGTDVLRQVLVNLRNYLINKGCKVLFKTKLINFENNVATVESNNTISSIEYDKLVLATGHSASDIYKLLKEKDVNMEPKNMSIGVRCEHLRKDINKMIYHGEYDNIPEAVYKLATHLENGRGVYTFCMCPGGVVVNATSENDHLVINGMSYKARNEENSNSAVLVNVSVDDFYHGDILDGIDYLRNLEHQAYVIGKGMPICQRLEDFLKGKVTKEFIKVKPSIKPSYTTGLLTDVLPSFVTDSIKVAFNDFNKKLPGFKDSDAVLTGIETRTSSPITVSRDDNFKTNINNLYCVGEGAGHAGGIMSSAVDGIQTAMKIIGDINE